MLIILSVGKPADSIYLPLRNHFVSRLEHLTKFKDTRIPHSNKEQESSKLLQLIKENDAVILFDERGKVYTSPELAEMIEQSRNNSKNIVCIIGGAYGVSDSVRSRADKVLSFGSSVFPHQLVHIMVLEQLYRAHSIIAGSGYHHE